MPSTASSRRLSYTEIEKYARNHSYQPSANVELPNFNRARVADKTRHAHLSVATAASAQVAAPAQTPVHRPHVVPSTVPQRQGRRAPLVVRINRALRTVLVAMCGMAIVGYGFDVAASNDVGKLQDQARRLNEQNSELSAQLLKAISFQGIQDSVLGRFGLRVPEQVLIVKEEAPPELPKFTATKHQFPHLSGY
ncbi:MAG TPA: hypothetical protein V6C81_21955 [Planktothrix sp.]|jgi:hypothetical protein